MNYLFITGADISTGSIHKLEYWRRADRVNIASDCHINGALLWKDEAIQFILLLCQIVSPILPHIDSPFSVEEFQLVPYAVHY